MSIAQETTFELICKVINCRSIEPYASMYDEHSDKEYELYHLEEIDVTVADFGEYFIVYHTRAAMTTGVGRYAYRKSVKIEG